ncbi:acyltransferase family protein [Nocardia sp. FBN12]|uniref:acyltransferase family protein n=1 Tax=Nocardia sp. FBN12 TaxID=3419766 RepID=UPI003D04FF3A
MTKAVDVVPVSTDPVEGKARTRGGRFEFLDALRGIAASAVVIEHCSSELWPAYARFSIGYFDSGVFGVFVFFIASGFIIPASMERGRSLGAFWVGRFFRLYPLFWVCLIAAVFLHIAGMYGGPPGFLQEPALDLATNATMAHYFIGGSDSQMLVVAWTLAFELAFYAFVSLLFIGGCNRRSVPVALFAIGSIPLAGVLLPVAMLSGGEANLRTRLIVVGVTVVVAAFFAWRAATKRAAAAAVLISAIVVPLVLNQPVPSAYAVTIFATMFVGTVLYRMTAGETSAWLGWGVFGLAVCLIAGLELLGSPLLRRTGDALPDVTVNIPVIGAYLVFAGALLLLRRSFPRPLLFLGRISFSLYLVHGFVINAVPKWPTSLIGSPAPWLTWCTWIIISIALATLSYNKIEKPALALGHRVMAKMDARARPAASPVG